MADAPWIYHWYVPTSLANDLRNSFIRYTQTAVWCTYHLSKSEGETNGVKEPSQTTVPALAATKNKRLAAMKDFMLKGKNVECDEDISGNGVI